MRKLGNSSAQPGKRRGVVSIAAALLGAALLCQPSLAYAAHGGGGGGFHGGGGGGFHGGGFHGGEFHAGGFHAGGFRGGGFHAGGFHGGGFHGGGFHGGVAGVHGGYGDHWYHGWRNGQYGWWWGDGLGSTYYPYDYGWDAYPDNGYYGYTQPYTAQTWYYCSDPAGYYPYVTQCNTGWQAVPAS
jgi:hypothetical protein